MSAHVELLADAHLGVRAPDPARHPDEAVLAESNQRAEADSVALLDRLVPGLCFATLGQRSDGGTLTVARARPELVDRLDGGALLDRLLRDHDLDSPRLKLARFGDTLDVTSVLERDGPDPTAVARVNPGRLALTLDAGTTLVLDGIDLKDPGLRRFSEHVERVYRTSININGYVSLRPHQSFGPHWDDHEVLIVHLLGHKHWEVRAPVALSPRRALHDPNVTGAPLWEGVVDPGTVLQVPRGWGHDVTGRDELTFHLTVTIPRTGVGDVVRSGLSQLHRDDDALVVIGCAADDDLLAPDGVRALVERGARADRMAETLATRAGNVRSRHDQSFSALLHALGGRTPDAELWVRSPHPGGIMVADRPGEGHTLVFGQRAVAASAGALALLAPCLDGRPHRVADQGPGGRARAVVDQAIHTGLLGVAAPPGTDAVLEP